MVEERHVVIQDDDFWAKRRAEAARRVREDPAYAAEVRATAERIKQERQLQEAEAQERRAERQLGLRLIQAG
jgi:hypothetical protein